MAKICKRKGIKLDVQTAASLQDISEGQILPFKEILKYLGILTKKDVLTEFFMLQVTKKSSLKYIGERIGVEKAKLKTVANLILLQVCLLKVDYDRHSFAKEMKQERENVGISDTNSQKSKATKRSNENKMGSVHASTTRSTGSVDAHLKIASKEKEINQRLKTQMTVNVKEILQRFDACVKHNIKIKKKFYD